jgi:arylsulfatase A-like enzyme
MTLPKTIDGDLATPGLKFYQAHAISPFAVPQLLDFALAAVDAEKLGQRDAPDLLCVGISQPDKMGHYYGPDSHEMMDSILRLDGELARFFGALDERVGRNNYVVVLTADHGVAPLPERVQAHHRHLHAGRFDGPELETTVEAALVAHYGELADDEAWFERDATSFRLTPAALAGRDAAEMRTVVREAVAEADNIAAAWTREELLAIEPEGSDLDSLVHRSYHVGRGADVFYAHQPYYFEREQGTTHGDPSHYDRHVPLIWMGPGIPAGQVADPVGVDDIALTLSGLLQIDGPPRAEGQRLF